jgi:hypothetical protein
VIGGCDGRRRALEGGCDGKVLRYGAGERHQQGKTMQKKVAQSGLCARSIAASASARAHTHALKLNYRPNGRRAPQRQERGWHSGCGPHQTITMLLQDPMPVDTRHQGHWGLEDTGRSRMTPEGPDDTRGIQETPVSRDGVVAVPDRGTCCAGRAAVPPGGAHEGDEIGKSIVLCVARAEEGERG